MTTATASGDSGSETVAIIALAGGVAWFLTGKCYYMLCIPLNLPKTMQEVLVPDDGADGQPVCSEDACVG